MGSGRVGHFDWLYCQLHFLSKLGLAPRNNIFQPSHTDAGDHPSTMFISRNQCPRIAGLWKGIMTICQDFRVREVHRRHLELKHTMSNERVIL